MIHYILENPLVMSLFFSFTINVLFFMIAFTFKTDKVTDLSYSLSFILLAPFLLFSRGGDFSKQQIFFTLAIVIWGFRLGLYLFIRILITKTDERFDDKRNNPLNLISFWGLQIVAVWAIMLPSTLFLTSRSVDRVSIFTFTGFFVSAAGLMIETVSDYQKFRFKIKKENKGKWMDRGLWNYSRHPNYFGEMLVWWGLFVVAVPFLSGYGLLTVVGPLSLSFLLLFVSGIPLLEESAEKRYGEDPRFLNYRNSTSLLILRPKRRTGKDS